MLVKLERSLDVVHSLDSLIGVLVLSKTDESETARAASVTILDDDLGKRIRWPTKGYSKVEREQTYGFFDLPEFLEFGT